jgi:hypothetical protein
MSWSKMANMATVSGPDLQPQVPPRLPPSPSSDSPGLLALVTAILGRAHLTRRKLLIGAGLGLGLLSIPLLHRSGSAQLNLVCQHNFRRAEITVRVDDDQVYRGTLTGTMRKRFGFLESGVQGSFSKTLIVPAGHHAVQVSVSPAGEPYELSQTTYGDFAENSLRTLSVSVRGGSVQLAWEDTGASSDVPTGAGYRKYTSSTLMTIWGSAMSAVVGFFIQEFLRSRVRARSLVSNPEKMVQ